MHTPLFRPEVAAAQNNQFMGELSIVHPLPMVRIIIGAAAAIMLLAVFIAAATYRQYVTVAGSLVPSNGMVTLQAPEDGVVVWRAGEEGARISAGDSLVQIDTGANTSAGNISAVTDGLLRSQANSLESSVETERSKVRSLVASLDERRQTYQHELTNLREQRGHADAQASLAQSSLERIGTLLDQKLISTGEHARAESDVLGRRTVVLDLERQIVAVQRQVSDLNEQADQARLALRTLEDDLQRRTWALEEQRVQNGGRGESVVRSTLNGRIAAWAVRVGESVSARAALVTVIPYNSRLEVHLAVPPSAIGQLRKGQVVSIACDAFPYQQFGRLRGTISKVALAPTPGSAEQSEFRAVVALESESLRRGGEIHSLRPGMTVSAEIYVTRTGLLADWAGSAQEVMRSIFA